MEKARPFTGFTPQTLKFFAELKRNNNRPWFQAHKEQYIHQVLEPAEALVVELGVAVNKMFPGHAVGVGPGGSIFRIYRDVRFSSDKTPYKTHLGVYFWHGRGKKLDVPGFYLEIDEDGLGLYAGWYIFPPPILQRYRHWVADEIHGEELVAARRRIDRGGLSVGGQNYKRVPRGFVVPADRENLMKHTGLYTMQQCGERKELFSHALVGYCVRQWKKTLPVYRWLVDLSE